MVNADILPSSADQENTNKLQSISKYFVSNKRHWKKKRKSSLKKFNMKGKYEEEKRLKIYEVRVYPERETVPATPGDTGQDANHCLVLYLTLTCT